MKKMSPLKLKHVNGYASLITLIIFVVFIIFVLPNESQKSEALGLISGPDTSLFYSADELYRIADAYGIIGRQFYIRQRFTFDIIWPIVYGSFLYINSIYFYKKNNFNKHTYLLYLPIIAVVFDYLENIMTSIVMYRYPNQTLLLDHMAGFMTAFKWITLSASFVVLAYFIFIYGVNKLKKIKNA
jgi:hypothetical protein